MTFGVSLIQARAHAPVPGFVEVFRRGSLIVELYRPRGHDPQLPHVRDELYVVVNGPGTYLCAGEGQPFAPDGGEQATTRRILGKEVRE